MWCLLTYHKNTFTALRRSTVEEAEELWEGFWNWSPRTSLSASVCGAVTLIETEVVGVTRIFPSNEIRESSHFSVFFEAFPLQERPCSAGTFPAGTFIGSNHVSASGCRSTGPENLLLEVNCVLADAIRSLLRDARPQRPPPCARRHNPETWHPPRLLRNYLLPWFWLVFLCSAPRTGENMVKNVAPARGD